MPKYLIEASYTGEGVRGLLKEGGTGRVEAVEKAMASLGGTVESFHFAFGDRDAVVIIDCPDNVTAAGLALSVASSGAVNIKTTPLLTPEEIDRAVKVRSDYKAPGA